ncbi:MAG: hypothetical protein FJ276_13450 [Planctomycetes bacterium]|nr:hypothetical protein [Planctomycetota bacterium]
MTSTMFHRRSFLQPAWAAALAGAGASNLRLLGGEPPTVTNPRATDGDHVHEPDWVRRVTITVGPDKAAHLEKTSCIGSPS